MDMDILEQALSSMTQKDIADMLGNIDPVTWIEHNRILKGKPFSFKDRDYLLQPYRDNSQNLIFYKGRQVEMSEFSMNWLLNKLHMNPYTAGLHTFPRDNQCMRFSKQRVDHAIKDSPFIGQWYDEKGSEIKMRKFLDTSKEPNPYNFYILGGTWESRKDSVGDAARGISIDFIVYDERQDHPNDVETVVGEGASHSEYKQTLTLGTPKLPGTQFDIQWETSDKKYWFVTCRHCGRNAPITMDNILETGNDEGDLYFYGCPKCKKPLDRLNGEWIATNPQKRPPYSGYHINQLMVCWLKPDEIMSKFLSPTYSKRRFYNEVLGQAYGGDDIPITWAMLEACANNQGNIGDSSGDIYVGVDWGSTSYAVLQNKVGDGHKIVDVIIVDDSDPREHPKRIAKELKKYKQYIKRVVCDAGPDITRSYALRDTIKEEGIRCKVWACYYTSPPAKTTINWNEKERNVTAGRTEILDMVIDEIADGRLLIPGNDKSMDKVDTFMEHCTNIAAEKSTTASGMEIVVYKDTGPDHFLHAKTYANIASYEDVGTPIGSVAPSFSQPRDIILNSSDTGKLLKFDKNTRQSGMFPTFGRRRR